MTRLIRVLAVTTISSVALGAPALRAQDKDKAVVTISGCVAKGTSDDTFMLTDVVAIAPAELPPAPDGAHGTPMYWLNNTHELSDHAGKRVEVTGIVDFDDEHKGETKVTVDPSKKKDTKTEIKADGKKVTVKTDELPKMKGAAKTTTTLDGQYFYDLHVVTVKPVPGSCPGK